MNLDCDPHCADAWTALFNGSVWGRLDFSRTLQSHSDDLSLRFRSPLRDGLLFETFARGSNAFLRCSLENGRIKVETNLGGELKVSFFVCFSLFPLWRGTVGARIKVPSAGCQKLSRVSGTEVPYGYLKQQCR